MNKGYFIEVGFEINAEGLPNFVPAAEACLPLGDISDPEAQWV